MPGPGTADAETARTAAVRLCDGLDGWRRHIVRQRSATVARRWLLTTLGTALAGVLAGRLDGSPLLTAVAVSSIALGAGAMSVVRSRKVTREDSARVLDATFGLDEQVATALWFADGRAAEQNPLVASLIERAVDLMPQAGGEADPRPAPAYGEWAAMAVTAAAIATVAAVPGTAPGPHPAAGGSNAAGEARGGPGTRATFVPSRTTSDPMRTGGSAAPASGTASPARGTAARSPDARPASPQPGGTATPGGGAPAGGTGQRPGGPARGSASGGGSSTATGGTASDRPGPPAAASDRPGPPAAAATGSGSRATTEPGTARTGTARSGTGAQPGAARSGTGAQAGTGQHQTGVPGGETAGRQPGADRTATGPAQLPPISGNRVLLIVLPGGDGLATASPHPGASGQQAEGNGETATATASGQDGGSGIAYVPPDGNEVPFGDQDLLGRYF